MYSLFRNVAKINKFVVTKTVIFGMNSLLGPTEK